METTALHKFGTAELNEQLEIEKRRVIQKYPHNYFIYQHRDLYSQNEELSKAEKRLLCQNPVETLKSQKRGEPELYFPRYRDN